MPILLKIYHLQPSLTSLWNNALLSSFKKDQEAPRWLVYPRNLYSEHKAIIIFEMILGRNISIKKTNETVPHPAK